VKVVVFTSSNLRHKAFAKRVFNSKSLVVEKIFLEKEQSINNVLISNEKSVFLKEHLFLRQIAEKDFFDWYVNYDNQCESIVSEVDRNWFSTIECLEIMQQINPDLIMVYGTTIIKGELIRLFKRKIINLHLGLSPYYRGSGTNFFPFANNQPEYAGATFLYLDNGIDTGEIIHQFRPIIYKNDSFHQLSNRFLKDAFNSFVYLIENFSSVKKHSEKEYDVLKNYNKTRKYYKYIDFNEQSLKDLYLNFEFGLINEYIKSRKIRDKEVPILKQGFL
tara:strand:- start:629 stop:1456 length:828 start_codon:yes stop_codon:yes gene_type:complete